MKVKWWELSAELTKGYRFSPIQKGCDRPQLNAFKVSECF